MRIKERTVPFADVNGHHLYYEVHGSGDRTVVLSHGFALDHDMWEPVVGTLALDHRVVVWDERGHGMTNCQGPFNYWDSASDCLGLMDVVGADTAVLVGMSQGGFLSLRAALEAPDRVQGLVLVNSAVQAFIPDVAAGLAQMSDAWTTAGPVGEIADAMVGLQFGASGYDGSTWAAKWRARPPADWKHPWNALLDRASNPSEVLTDRLAKLECPVSVIHGEQDAGFPVAMVQEMNDLLRDGRGLTVIPGASHCPPLTHPEQVSEALVAFLRSL
jgi:pimeloyl-ACP methyl ester carboxylesterase